MTDKKPIKTGWNKFAPENHDSWFDRGFDEASMVAHIAWVSYDGTAVEARYYDGNIFDLVRTSDGQTTEALTMTPGERGQFEHMCSLMDEIYIEQGEYHPMDSTMSWFIEQDVLVAEAHRPYHDDERFGFTETDRRNFQAFVESARLKFHSEHHDGELNLSPRHEPVDDLPVFGDPS